MSSAASRSVLLPALLLWACAERRAWVASPPEGFALQILIVSDAATGTRTRLIGRVGDAVQRVDLAPGEELILMAFTTDSLASLRPPIDLGQLDSATLVEASSSCTTIAITPDDRAADVPLLGSFVSPSVFRAGKSGFDPVSDPSRYLVGTSVRLPLLPSPCVQSASLRTFGAHGAFIPSGSAICGSTPAPGMDTDLAVDFKSVVPLDADRVAALSATALYVFDRRNPYADVSGQRLCASAISGSFGGTEWLLGRIVSLDPPDATVSRLLALGAAANEGISALFEIAIEAAGPRITRTTTITQGMLREMLLEADGRLLLLGGDGLVLSATSARGVFHVDRIAGEDLRSVVETGLANDPHLIATGNGRVILGDLHHETFHFAPSEVLSPGNSTAFELGVFESRGLREIWAAQGNAIQHSSDGVRWEEVVLHPPQSSGCALTIGPCGSTHGLSQARGLVQRGEDLILLANDCPSLVTYRPASDCAATIARPDAPIPAPVLRTFGRWNGVLTIGGRSGTLYQIDP